MGTVIDHLRPDYRVRVIQAFTDAHGVLHEPGETGVIRQMGLDWPEELWIEWERNGVSERMAFRLDARQGPRSSAMRDFFELGDFVPPPRPAPAMPAPPQLPAREMMEGLIWASARYEEAVDRVAALAANQRFDEARAQILEITGWPCESGWRIQEMARHLTGMAAAHVEDADPTVYLWLKEWAIQLWYMWGSGATSGGEGAAFAVEIRAGEKVLAELDARRERTRLRLDPTST